MVLDVLTPWNACVVAHIHSIDAVSSSVPASSKDRGWRLKHGLKEVIDKVVDERPAYEDRLKTINVKNARKDDDYTWTCRRRHRVT